MRTHVAASRHWYREPWPWLLMAGPAAVIVAGAITVYLAIVSNDGLVADDYYKRGLAINQTLARDAAAQKFDYRARIEFAADFGGVQVRFESSKPAAQQLMLRLAHAGRPALDRLLPLTPRADGTYAAVFPALTAGRWQVILEDAGRRWRLVGDIVVPGRATVLLAPR
jgi:hypothetical protein